MTKKIKIYHSLKLPVIPTQFEMQQLNSKKFKVCVHAGDGRMVWISEDGQYNFETIPTSFKLKNKTLLN